MISQSTVKVYDLGQRKVWIEMTDYSVDLTNPDSNSNPYFVFYFRRFGFISSHGLTCVVKNAYVHYRRNISLSL